MKYFLTFIFLCVGFSTKADSSSVFNAGDSLFYSGNFRIAAIEYERAAYLTESNVIRTQALLKKSECFFGLGNFEEAVNTLGRVSYYDLSDELLSEVYYKSALYAYLGADFTTAESQLLQLDFYVKDERLKKESLYLHILVLNELQKWELSKIKMMELIESSGLSEQDKTSQLDLAEKLYNTNNIPRLKSIEKAQKLASFLPGTGHLYAGYFWEGVVNAGFQVVFLGLTAYGIYVKYYATALAISFTFFQKFYVGAMPRLEYLVNKRNYEVTRAYNNKLKSIVLDITEKNSH